MPYRRLLLLLLMLPPLPLTMPLALLLLLLPLTLLLLLLLQDLAETLPMRFHPGVVVTDDVWAEVKAGQGLHLRGGGVGGVGGVRIQRTFPYPCFPA